MNPNGIVTLHLSLLDASVFLLLLMVMMVTVAMVSFAAAFDGLLGFEVRVRGKR